MPFHFRSGLCRHVSNDSRRTPSYHCVCRDIVSDQRTRADHSAFADFNSAHDDCAAAYRGALANHRPLQSPILFTLRLAVSSRRPWIAIVDENDAMADKYFVLNQYPRADECMARNLALAADARVALNFHECPDAGIVADFASV